MHCFWHWGLPLLLAAAPFVSAPARGFQGRALESYALIDIAGLDGARLDELKSWPGLIWWVELGEQLLVRSRPAWQQRWAKGRLIQRFAHELDDERLYFVRLPLPVNRQELEVLAEGGRFAVVRTPNKAVAPGLERLETSPDSYRDHGRPSGGFTFQPNMVLARSAKNWPVTRVPRKDRPIENLLDSIDVDRWFADLFYLACINRYSLNGEINDATWWLAEQLRELPGMTVSIDSFALGGTRAKNVIGVLRGTERPDDWFIVGAHYDSISEAPFLAAPGAEDNGSGTAAVLELARIFALHPPRSTLLFICYSGEELGLLGSRHHAQSLLEEGDQSKIKGVLTMDMIGYTMDDDLDCLLETGEPGEGLLEPFMNAAAAYTNLRIVVSLFPFGSDHVPYLTRAMPALLTIENDWNQYPGYHRTTDTPEMVSLAMGLEVLKMNLAALAEMAGIAETSPFSGAVEVTRQNDP